MQRIFKVLSNEAIAADTYKLVLKGDTSAFSVPGQFANILIDGFYLRRPISVCDISGDKLTLIYKRVGAGTAALSACLSGCELDLLTGLGNGFSIIDPDKFSTPLIIGGGVGVPPLYLLAKTLISAGFMPVVILGFNDKNSIFYEQEFKRLGCEVFVTTADGSYGINGFVTDAIPKIQGFDYYYACGPQPMLKAVYDALDCDGQMSFEERMACGFGACMGCSCKTKAGNKRICKDGPVLTKDEIIF